MNRNGAYDAGIDRKSISKPNSVALTAAGAAAGSTATDLAATGVVSTSQIGQIVEPVGSTAGYTDDKQTSDGLTVESKTPTPAANSNGAWTTTTTNPDQTKVVDTYGEGLLTNETTLGTGGATLTVTSFAYDGLRRLSSKTDYRGTTNYTYFQDGTTKTVQEPGHNAVTVNTIDTKTNASTQDTRADSQTVNTPQNLLGQYSAQAGAGVLPATYGYDASGTGQLTSLTTYRGTATFSGNTITGSGDKTTWVYDQATGLLKSKKYADNTQEIYTYNGRFQLVGVNKPGISASSFAYNNAGQLTSSSLTDATTGKVSMNVTGYDETGRPVAVADTDNGKTYTTSSKIDDHGRTVRTVFGSAGGLSINHVYAPDNTTVATESPGALTSMTVNSPDGLTALATTTYGYDSSSKRLKTITVNNVTFTINYGFSLSDQISSWIAIPASGGSGVTTTYVQDTADKARISRVNVSGSLGEVFRDQVAAGGFNQLDQITGRTVTRTEVNDAGTMSTSQVATAYGYTYDPNKGDALTAVSVTVNGAAADGYSYGLDNVGNFTGNSSLGTANNVNQYSQLTYNQRGDVTDDGTYAYGYDANDRLIKVTPHDTSKPQLKYGYDSQGRRLWKTVYTFTGGAWAPSYSRHYLWDGNNLVAELDGSNVLLTGYTWGPASLMAVTDYTPASGGPKTYVVVMDLSGNIAALVNPGNGAAGAGLDADNGKVVASYHYDPYGNPLTNGATGPKKDVGDVRGKGLRVDKEVPDLLHAEQRDARGNTWLEADKTSELVAGFNRHAMYDGDPINKSDTSGLATRAQDPLAERPGYRSVSQVMNEARAEVAAVYGLGPNTPTSQIVEKHWYGDKTYGDLLDKIYYKKVSWYWSNSDTYFVEPDQLYAEDVAAYRDPSRIYADNRTPDERQRDKDYSALKQAVAEGKRNPQALLAADIARRNDSMLGALVDAGRQVAPDLAAAYVGLKAPGPYASLFSEEAIARQVDAQLTSEAEGIIYRRTNPLTGRTYVGQAKDLENYLVRQRAHDNSLRARHDYEILVRVQSDRLSLDVAEESQIRLNGGPKSQRGGVLENSKYVMNDATYREAGGAVAKPTRPR